MSENLIARIKSRIFIIESDLSEVGAYLHVYENGKDIADHLQDSERDCIDFALEEFDVPLNAWVATDRSPDMVLADSTNDFK